MKFIGLIIVIVTGVFLAFATVDFPNWADPASPASTHVSPRYIEKSMSETSVPNIVTAVLADYRGYDTMFETAVIFASGVVCFFLMRTFKRIGPEEQLYRHTLTNITVRIKRARRAAVDLEEFERVDTVWAPHDLIIKSLSRIMIPFIQLFGLYVIAHGHHSPGGGFQGGVILGASIILMAISHDLRTALKLLQEKVVGLLCAIGVLIYAGVGALCLLFGFNFLDYRALSAIVPVDQVTARSTGILIVEVGVGMAVMATMIVIFNTLSSTGKYDEGL